MRTCTCEPCAAIYVASEASGIPSHMHEGLANYIVHHRATGGFLTSVLEGDVRGAEMRADHMNSAALSRYWPLLTDIAPAAAWGTREKCAAWLAWRPDAAPPATNGKPRIFLFVNSRAPEWYVTMAMAEDGHVLAGHCSSSEGWARHDIGMESDWKHDEYRKHYPDGFQLEWVDDPPRHAGLMAAYALNQAMIPAEAPSSEVQP